MSAFRCPAVTGYLVGQGLAAFIMLGAGIGQLAHGHVFPAPGWGPTLLLLIEHGHAMRSQIQNRINIQYL
ncbi:MAG: hypothetical protein U5O39_12390 [Gammaproteobacteria bacterium]|nr:hypothetical protein [Gammaproteobacteria bacterium]